MLGQGAEIYMQKGSGKTLVALDRLALVESLDLPKKSFEVVSRDGLDTGQENRYAKGSTDGGTISASFFVNPTGDAYAKLVACTAPEANGEDTITTFGVCHTSYTDIGVQYDVIITEFGFEPLERNGEIMFSFTAQVTGPTKSFTKP